MVHFGSSILIVIGIGVLLYSFSYYIKFSKQYLRMTRELGKQWLIYVYEILIGAFIISYIASLLFLQLNQIKWEWLIGGILFGGSVFVCISVITLDNLAKSLWNTKLNITDALTGLLNREGAQMQAEQLMQQGTPLTLIIIDLDNFKAVNDTLGHAEGDNVIRETGKIFRDIASGEDIVSRYGGDEFLIIKRFIPEDEANVFCQKMIAAFKHCLGDKYENIKLGCSVGVAASLNEDNYESLFKRADESLYQAKKDGKNTYILYPLPEEYFDEKTLCK